MERETLSSTLKRGRHSLAYHRHAVSWFRVRQIPASSTRSTQPVAVSFFQVRRKVGSEETGQARDQEA